MTIFNAQNQSVKTKQYLLTTTRLGVIALTTLFSMNIYGAAQAQMVTTGPNTSPGCNSTNQQVLLQ